MSERTASEKMPEFDESDVQRVLVVVAHPDDTEYGTSAAVSAWTARGIEVAYLLLTGGEAGMQRAPDEARAVRAIEQRNACDAVGVERLTILDFPDGELEYGIPLRRAIAQEIRTFRPQVVVSGSGELRVPWGLDHPDHRAVGLSTIDAVRDADNRWVFMDQLEGSGLEPWGATWLLLTGTEANCFVEVGESDVTRAVDSLAQHREYLADLPWHPAPHDFIPNILKSGGRQAHVPYAVTFESHRLRA